MEIKEALRGFHYKKQLGQNFITDANLLDAVVADAGVQPDDTVVEIGVGAGTLTRALAKRAARVIGFEVDVDLKGVQAALLGELSNVQVHFADVLKLSDEQLGALIGGPFSVVANLPYYVTTPILMRFLESTLPLVRMTVMVQQEVAARLCAPAGSREGGAITLQVQLRGRARLTRTLSRTLFYPVPGVDSALVRIDLSPACDPARIPALSRLIKAAFSMRRKTLANNLCSAYGVSRPQAEHLLALAGLDSRVRGETLTVADYMRLEEAMRQGTPESGR